MIFNCPGSQKFKNPQPENIKCPCCGSQVEIWTDEVSAICASCGKKVARGEDQSCLDWCRYAKDCVGQEIYNRYMKNKK